VVRPARDSIDLRLRCGGLLALVAVVVLAASPSAAATRQLKSPRAADVAIAGQPITDSILSSSAVRRLAVVASWGGTLTSSTGEHVAITFSDTYPVDSTRAQGWADYFASLLHGSELSAVHIYLAPLGEVQLFCGQNALACYSPNQHLIVGPGDDPSPDLTAEAVVTHEYGHHVASSRSDAPWNALDYGTKRWSSYMQVCSKSQSGELFPGAENDSRYRLNPGEGFAESYRVLNQRRLGVFESPWQVVSQSLYPDANALAALEQDVTTPWTANTQSSLSTSLTKRAKTRTLTVQTPLDGSFRITIRAAKGERIGVNLLTSTGTSAGRTVVAGTASRSIATTVCGSRTYSVKLSLTKGSGRARATISKA
jgi:hypothetical protein